MTREKSVKKTIFASQRMGTLDFAGIKKTREECATRPPKILAMPAKLYGARIAEALVSVFLKSKRTIYSRLASWLDGENLQP
jgi:hypothetical protein